MVKGQKLASKARRFADSFLPSNLEEASLGSVLEVVVQRSVQLNLLQSKESQGQPVWSLFWTSSRNYCDWPQIQDPPETGL